MPADQFSTTQLAALRQQIEADVSYTVTDTTQRTGLLQLISARFEHIVHSTADTSLEQTRGEHNDDHSDTTVSSHTLIEATDSPPQLEASLQPITADATAASDATRSKRRKKKGSTSRAATATSNSSPLSQPPPQSESPLSSQSPSAERDVDLQSAAAVTVRLDYNDQTGRLVRAVTPLPAGTQIMSDAGYVAVIKLERCREVCALCHSLIDDSDKQSRLSCVDCRVSHYCSLRCQRIDSSYRHPTLCRMLAAVGRLSGSVSVDADLLQMLAAVCARHYREKNRDRFKTANTLTAATADYNEQTDSALWRDDELVRRIQTH